MATANLLPELVAKTVLADYNDVEDRLPGTYEIFPQSTINTKYQVFNTITDILEPPPLAYFGLGIKGFYNTGDDNQSAPYPPNQDQFDLFQPIPFRCVPVDEDLDTATRNKYRMRVRQTFNGQSYWCYYLKCIEPVENSAKIVRIEPVTKQEIPYEMSTAQLTPKPQMPSTSGTQDGTITSVVVTKQVRCSWTGSEIYESVQAMFNGNLLNARISEYGLYSGVDRVVDGYDASGNTLRYTEAIYTQLAYKICNLGTVVPAATYDGTRIFTFGNGKLLLQTA